MRVHEPQGCNDCDTVGRRRYVIGDVLLNEQRLRELYAAGAISLDDLNRGLEIMLRRETARRAGPSPRASAPLTPAERAQAAERIAARDVFRRPATALCTTCQSELRLVTENGVQAAWCPGCQHYVGADPRDHPAVGASPNAALAVGYMEIGPDGDGDGDVDGGLLDQLRDLLS